MKRPILKTSLLLVAIFAGNCAHAQFISRSVVANAAETFITPPLRITYVLGEPIADFLPGTGTANAPVVLTAGFHQPDIDVQNMLNTNISAALVLYPNPATGGSVKLAFNHIPDGTYTVNVVDAAGKILQSQTVTYSNHNFLYLSIDISQLAGGVYFLSVTNIYTYFQGQVKLIKL